jgi:hypothetical protein
MIKVDIKIKGDKYLRIEGVVILHFIFTILRKTTVTPNS